MIENTDLPALVIVAQHTARTLRKEARTKGKGAVERKEAAAAATARERALRDAVRALWSYDGLTALDEIVTALDKPEHAGIVWNTARRFGV